MEKQSIRARSTIAHRSGADATAFESTALAGRDSNDAGGRSNFNSQVSDDDGNMANESKKTSFGVRFKSGLSEYARQFKKFGSARFSAAYVAKIAVLTALAFVLYSFCKFNLPFMFPSFLEMQISELPALLAGFSMGPLSGLIVIVLKCLLKFPLTSTAYVGESTDMLLGIAFVLPASIIYHLRRDKLSRKSGVAHALVGLTVGSILMTGAAILVNRYISVPFYVTLFFNGNFMAILSVVKPIYPNVTEQTFYTYYLFLGVLPFNLLRCIIVSLLTFLLYKRLSVVLHWEGTALTKQKSIAGTYTVHSAEETRALARRLADELEGGETIVLSGELGAGKTTFTKGLAAALGVKEEVTSPTFTILNVYEDGRLKLNHLDMYRVESADELEELGISECFDGDSVTVIEWNKFEKIDGKCYAVDISRSADFSGGDDKAVDIGEAEDDGERVIVIKVEEK